VRKPATTYYRNIRLKALVWDDYRAYITDYNPTNGAPLNKPIVKNAIVTYADNSSGLAIRNLPHYLGVRYKY
jgi:hypothetical protein